MKISRKHSGVSLIELMVVIGITAVLLAMGSFHYRKSHNTQVFNDEVEQFYANLKSAPVLAQASGVLTISGGVDFKTLADDINNLQSLDSGSYFWVLRQNGEVKGMGKIGSTETTSIKLNNTYKSYSGKTITQGSWMEIYTIARGGVNDLPLDRLLNESKGKLAAKIVFQADGSPIVPGKIEICTLANNKISRKRIVEIDKNGGIKLSTGKI